ncbi:MAG: dTDP-4-amino-4,6-dideoxygalactose transaminase [Planctomycetes bacterium]|nr:dTDP-4-amino-4,6-dideoxygalactose transaminase [Planctomycetota bacterium]
MEIPFNRFYLTGKELEYVRQAQSLEHLCGDGPFSKKCASWLQEKTGCRKALIVPSCTAALEMAAMLLDIRPGDEVIMPSFTFVSTANAFVVRGGVPVFVDIRGDTLNLDESLVEAALTGRTRAIVPVHYAGVGCEMDALVALAAERDLPVIEDAAHGILASYKGRGLGSIGHLAGLSFHETKNVVSGEGGALLINDARFERRAEIIREKGTNRCEFLRGAVDRYTWVDIGSSYLPSEIVSAFLWAQLEQSEDITKRRLAIWRQYHAGLADLERQEKVRRPVVPEHCGANAHLYYLLLPDEARRESFIRALAERGVEASFHYVPLHSSPAGMRFGRAHGDLALTDEIAGRLVRLPLWTAMEPAAVDRVLQAVEEAVRAF